MTEPMTESSDEGRGRLNEAVEIGAYGQAMQTISDMRTRFARESQEHARKARALRTAEAENARLRARLEAVEALAEKWRNDDHRDVRRCGHDLRAALASPTSHAQREAEVGLGDLVARLRAMAAAEFDERGPRDPRGAAIWDVAAFIAEDYAPARAGALAADTGSAEG